MKLETENKIVSFDDLISSVYTENQEDKKNDKVELMIKVQTGFENQSTIKIINDFLNEEKNKRIYC